MDVAPPKLNQNCLLPGSKRAQIAAIINAINKHPANMNPRTLPIPKSNKVMNILSDSEIVTPISIRPARTKCVENTQPRIVAIITDRR